MKTKLLAIALFAATAGLVYAWPAAQSSPVVTAPVERQQQAQRPRVEAVFVLDTTGSMGGLIEAAKENIWSIASSLAAAQPAPDLRIGLVAFRDRGDAYVTRVIDLSADLDSMYAQLMDFRAEGGGDTPESVNKALLDAVQEISWSQDPQAFRTIFLIGDAPPHMYPDELHYPEILRRATAKGIRINAIQAGEYAATRPVWEEIAQLGQGAYFQVEQSGNRVAVATPFDTRIAELSARLDATRLSFGDAERQREAAAKQSATEKLHAAASPEARAKRAAFNASASGRSNLLGDSDLVAAVTAGTIALDEIAPEHLPAPMLALSPAEQAKFIEETATERDQLGAEIAQLAAQRQEHIRSEMAKRDGKESTLDYQLLEAVRKQAAEKGLDYAAEPTL